MYPQGRQALHRGRAHHGRGLPHRPLVPVRPHRLPPPEQRDEERVGEQQYLPDRQLVESPRRRHHLWSPHDMDTLARPLRELLQAPEEVDVLADPHVLVVAADSLERAPAAELRGPWTIPVSRASCRQHRR